MLIVAFVVIGAAVYQVTAPAPTPGETSFSFGQVLEHLRRGVRGNRASAEATTTTTHPVDPAVTDLSIGQLRGDVTITGEDRDTIEAEFNVRSNGYDEAEAKQFIKQSVLTIERAGSGMRANAVFPRGGVQRMRLVLKVPARLQVRMESTGGPLKITNVAALEVGVARGDTAIGQVKGRVTTTQRGGELVVTDCGSVKLTTIGSDVRLERVRGEASLNMRSGELKASELGGPIDLDTTNTDVALEKLEKATGIIRITAASGDLKLSGLRTEGRIDVRDTHVDAIVDRAAPLAIYSQGGESVALSPPARGDPLDAVATDASITMPEGTLQVTTTGQERRASGAVHGGGPTIIIRTTRGDISIRSR